LLEAADGSSTDYGRLMAPQRFTGKLEAGRGGGAFVVLPGAVLESLGGGSRFRVTGTLNADAKRADTRARRIAQTLERLRA